MIFHHIHSDVRGSLSILLTSQQTPTLQTKSNYSFCEKPGHGVCSQCSSQSRLHHFSQLWTNLESSTSVWAPVPFQVHTAKTLKSTSKVCLDFFSSGGLNWKSPLTGTRIHEGAQFASVVNQLQFLRHLWLSVTYNCIGNHKSSKKPNLHSPRYHTLLRIEICVWSHILALHSSFPHLSHKLMSMGKKISVILSSYGRATASLTKHHPMI